MTDLKKMKTSDLIQGIVEPDYRAELDRRIPVPEDAEAPDEGSTIDGREKLLYEMRQALDRLVSVIMPKDKARCTWAYEHALTMLEDTEEWTPDEEHAFGKEWQARREARRQRVPK